VALVVIGGHTRNIGKTALVVDLIGAFPQARWTAVKITQYGHGVCSVHGRACGCAPTEHAVALDEEFDRNGRTDTSRFLAAGAERALWLRARQGQLAAALPVLRQVLAGAANAILESNSVLGFLRPDLYLVVLDPRVEDFKPSLRHVLDRADALVLRAPLGPTAWRGVSLRQLEARPRFLQPLGAPLPGAMIEFIRPRLAAAQPPV
jgi:molybdopterin-guanine dinucleotide biosynthesis protein